MNQKSIFYNLFLSICSVLFTGIDHKNGLYWHCSHFSWCQLLCLTDSPLFWNGIVQSRKYQPLDKVNQIQNNSTGINLIKICQNHLSFQHIWWF